MTMTPEQIAGTTPMPSDVREVLERAWNALHDHQKAPWSRLAVGNGMERFRRLLDAKAYVDAALMLVPEGWDSINIRRTDDGLWHVALAGNDAHMMAEDPDEFYVEAEDCSAPAIALATAAIKAKEQ